jgi:gamma-glutamylcyclotransferase (GGCT)/AIG2-like uncharacterized protein YtfP
MRDMRAVYFAYGSNMDEQHLRKHCPSALCLGSARLDGHRLTFLRRSVRTGTGVADIVADPGAAVWGAVFELEETDLGALDRKEGDGVAYRRREAMVTLRGDGAPRRVHLYTVITKEDSEVTPSREYLTRMIAAAEGLALPPHYVATLRARPFEG